MSGVGACKQLCACVCDLLVLNTHDMVIKSVHKKYFIIHTVFISIYET